MRAALVCGFVVAGCEPPPAPGEEDAGPSIEILDPRPGQVITLNDQCQLDTLLVVNIEGLEVVAPDPENVVEGQGHWHGGPDLAAGYCISWHSFCVGGDTPPTTYAGDNVEAGTAKLFAALTDNAHAPLDVPEASVEITLVEPEGGCAGDL
jgi:hypothetical protein